MQEQMLRLAPNGCIDAINGRVENGECPDYSVLSNWVPSSDTPRQWVPRPASLVLGALTIPATCHTVVGNYVVGMTNDPAGSGKDIPFVFNLLNSTFLTVNGVNTATNCPTSPSAGDWQPPHAEPIGTYVLFSHTGYSGTGSNFFGAINLGAGTAGAVQVVLNAGSSWTAPANWNSANNTVQCIGSGANGNGGGGGAGGGHGGNGNASQGGDGAAGGSGGTGGTGGQGAGWAQYTNLALTPGTPYSYSIGTAGGPTWFDTATTVQAVGGSSGTAYGTTTAPGGAGSTGGGGSAGTGGSAHYYGTGGSGGSGGYGGGGGQGGAAAGPAGFAGTGGAGAGASGGGGGGYGAGSGQNGGGGGTGYGNYGGAANGYGDGGGGGCGGPGGGGGGGGGEKSSGSLGGSGGGSSPGGGGAGGGGVIIITYYPAIAPLTYTVQNTLTNALPSVPVWITQYNGRAYFALNPGGNTPPSVMCSDVLGVASGPLSRSAAVQGVILTFADLTPLVGMGCLSLTNLTTGGVVQALYVFKSAQQGSPDVFQITGDVAGASGSGTSNLSLQKLNSNVSTTAPNSIISTPLGLFFAAADGLRYIDLEGHMQPPVGYGGSGKPSPFVNASPQSRIAGAYNASTLCFGMFNSVSGNTETWVYDITRGCWHGPHTFPVGLINSLGNSFLVSPYISSGVHGLYNFSLIPTATSSYTELGGPMQCVAASALVPDRNEMKELSAVRALAYLGVPAGGNLYNVSMKDVDGNVLGTSAIYTGYTESAPTFLAPFDITWANPLVFNMASVSVSTTAAAGVRLGSFQLPVSQSGFTSRAPGN